MKTIHAILFVLSAAAVPASVASAAHDSPLLTAACEYRDAVKHFERTVQQVRFIDHYDVRLVNRLEDAACEMHIAARHPERLDRLEYRWHEVQSLHRRAEAAIFGRSCYPQHPALIRCWERVSCAYRELAAQVECACNAHQVHRPPVGSSCGHAYGLPQTNFPAVTVPPPPMPGFASPRMPFPGTVPPAFAPNVPQLDHRARPNIAPQQRTGPLTDEVRYFGPRQYDQLRSGRPHVDAHFTGHDLRAAMIGAMLSRLGH